ncbi:MULTISPECIES: hypothetical protein [unclassified Streptomyces]|uniref:hypothetical protein n=1 Tax=unclassified Streptomyces TaxID=2593676 RepID=UPI00093E9489|nr:hypothetical protein [Streptomyces sp. CB01883]OKJ74454.1 hypothetical protein AMK32_36410 [Streptomyces sp. CB01883]
MPDTDRLYALSSTYNHPWLSGPDGPALLIHDPVVAMRWYLTTEREENLAVTGHVSDDHGATWRPLLPRELMADAERALAAMAEDGGPQARQAAGILRDALAADAADWLDHRLRYVQPDDPTPYRPDEPSPESWQRGGHIWALALGTLPDEDVLKHLTARFTAPQSEGAALLRTGAAEMLDALALAEAPSHGESAQLLAALGLLNRLGFGFETGQLDTLAEDAQRRILDHLVAVHPATAAVAAAHPEPGHGANMAARAYLHRLSLIGTDGEPRLLDDAAAALAEAVRAAEQQPDRAPDPGAKGGEAPAIPGYPKRLEGDLQAAAQWRLISPAARRAAEQAMDRLARATSALAQATAAADVNQPPSLQEDAALLSHRSLHQDLEELTARHALLMHASVLADAEAAAEPAKHAAVVAAAQATEARPRPGTAAEMVAAEDAFMAHVTGVEDRIAESLAEQRRLTVEALQRIFPSAVTSTGRHTVRRNLLENSGLSLDAYQHAYRAIGESAGKLQSVEAAYRSGAVSIGRPPVSHEDVEQARAALQRAQTRFADLRISRPNTLRALKALDGATHHEPSPPDARAARAARIAAQSRERSNAAPAAPRPHTAAEQARQAHHSAAQQHQPGVRPA